MSRPRFIKEPATVDAQLAKLEYRGCIIEDRAYAKSVLEKINYYRLAHYFAVFEEDGGAAGNLSSGKQYRDGTSFNKVARLYDFDRRLRGNLLIYLEEIEITMRAVVSNFHALKYGALGYLNDATFSHNHNHKAFLSRVDRLIESNSHMPFVSHYNKKHGAFPLWVLMELFSFGMLSHFYDNMHKQDKKEIAEKYFGGNLSVNHIGSWLDSLSALRNHCAHYCRLYDSRLEPAPKALEAAPFKMNDAIFSFIYVMRLMNRRQDASLVTQIAALFEEYADVAEKEALGFPEGWEEILSPL